MKPYAELTPEAEADLAEAFDYYEDQIAGLGHEFVTTLEQQLERVVENPSQYQVRYREVRRAVMRRFPYAVFYLVEGEAVVVLAIAEPRTWRTYFCDAWVSRTSRSEVPGKTVSSPLRRSQRTARTRLERGLARP